MQVRQIITTGLIIAEIMLLFSSSAQAQNKKPSVECNTVLQKAKKQIQNNRKVKVVYTGQEDISQHYKIYPINRPFSYQFVLVGSATQSILNSEKFLTAIATDIINKCPKISIVDFGQDQTDYGKSYGLLEDNKIGIFKCVDWEVAPKKLDWGYISCL